MAGTMSTPSLSTADVAQAAWQWYVRSGAGSASQSGSFRSPPGSGMVPRLSATDLVHSPSAAAAGGGAASAGKPLRFPSTPGRWHSVDSDDGGGGRSSPAPTPTPRATAATTPASASARTRKQRVVHDARTRAVLAKYGIPSSPTQPTAVTPAQSFRSQPEPQPQPVTQVPTPSRPPLRSPAQAMTGAASGGAGSGVRLAAAFEKEVSE